MIAVLVPRRADGGRRDRTWQWIRNRWETEHSWAVYEGHHDDGPFNRSAAINRAARDAGDWDVAIIGDADSFVSKDQIEEAVERCMVTGQMTLAYDRWVALSAFMSDQIMGGYEGDWTPGVLVELEGSCSSMVVVTRKLWDEARGFDEGFEGWGMEDVAASLAFQTFGGGFQRIAGPVWHLYHDSGPRENEAANVERMHRYRDCDYDPVQMRTLIEELHA